MLLRFISRFGCQDALLSPFHLRREGFWWISALHLPLHAQEYVTSTNLICGMIGEQSQDGGRLTHGKICSFVRSLIEETVTW